MFFKEESDTEEEGWFFQQVPIEPVGESEEEKLLEQVEKLERSMQESRRQMMLLSTKLQADMDSYEDCTSKLSQILLNMANQDVVDKSKKIELAEIHSIGD